MARTITEYELAQADDALFDAVERGEIIIVTQEGRAVAELRPIAGRRWRGAPTEGSE